MPCRSMPAAPLLLSPSINLVTPLPLTPATALFVISSFLEDREPLASAGALRRAASWARRAAMVVGERRPIPWFRIIEDIWEEYALAQGRL